MNHLTDWSKTSPPSDSLLPTRLKQWEQHPNSVPHSALTFPTQTSPPFLGFLPRTTSIRSPHTSHRNSVSVNHSPRHSCIDQSPTFDPACLYPQNSTASSSSLHSPPSVPMPMKQSPSPLGTSSSFDNPSFAPSPPLSSFLSPDSNPVDSSHSNPFDLGGGMKNTTFLGLRDSTDFSAFQNLSKDPAQATSSSNNSLPGSFASSPSTYPTPGGWLGEGITPKDKNLDPLAVSFRPGDREEVVPMWRCSQPGLLSSTL